MNFLLMRTPSIRVSSRRSLAGRANLTFFSLGEATSPSDRSKRAIGFRFWEGSGYFRSSFFFGFAGFPLYFSVGRILLVFRLVFYSFE
jgi:hypothetical protein